MRLKSQNSLKFLLHEIATLIEEYEVTYYKSIIFPVEHDQGRG